MIADPIVGLWQRLEMNLCSGSGGVSNGRGWETPTGNDFACLFLHLFSPQLLVGPLSVGLLAYLGASVYLPSCELSSSLYLRPWSYREYHKVQTSQAMQVLLGDTAHSHSCQG